MFPLAYIVAEHIWGGTSGVARRFIEEGEVRVNGKVVTDANATVNVGDTVDLEGYRGVTVKREWLPKSRSTGG